jgi:formylglycine-generating enzyme required for sulfatase activity
VDAGHLAGGGRNGGVGLAFLEETLGPRASNPERRRHSRAAQAVLNALLPEQGSDIKGHMRSGPDLLAASGHAAQPGEFRELLRILDGELRLVTPTDPEGQEEDPQARSASDGTQPAGASAVRYYQLTHDYLVPSLREWLTRKQRETRRGRAELRLAERAAAWQAKRENRHLPAWWEWLNIRLYTRKKNWTEPQRKMMRRAGRYHGTRGLLLAACLLLLLGGGWEGFGRLEARNLRHRLLEANTEDVPGIVRDMGPYRRWLDVPLREAYREAEANHDARKQLHISLALLPVDDGQEDFLFLRLFHGEAPEVHAIREGMRSRRVQVSEQLWWALENRKFLSGERLRVAAALADYEPDNMRWEGVRTDVAAALVAQDALVVARWADLLWPVRRHLLPPLADAFLDQRRPPAQRATIAHLYASYAEHRSEAYDPLEKLLAAKVEGDVAGARRQAYAAAALDMMGRWKKVLPLLRHSPDPTARSYLIRELGAMGDARGLRQLLLRDPRLEVSVRRALVLALGDFDQDRLSLAERELWIPDLEKMYREDPDAGIHGAAAWLLREWGQAGKLAEMDQELRMRDREVASNGCLPAGGRQWYVNGQGQTLVVLPPGKFLIGEEQRQQQWQIDHSFALAAQEVTLAEFLRFRKEHGNFKKNDPTLNCPVNGVSWYDAAAYCNWLSAQEGIDESQWCYQPKQGKGLRDWSAEAYGAGMRVPRDYLRRAGYRLPTEEEWEYACRAGSTTAWSMGDAGDLLRRYAWYETNAEHRSHPVGSLRPNDWGLFDLHGNAWEWCQDRLAREGDIKIKEDINIINDRYSRLLRGGAFNDHAGYVRSADRAHHGPASRNDLIGFRPARTFR